LLSWQEQDGQWVASKDAATFTLEATIPIVNDDIDEINKATAEQLARQFTLNMSERLAELPEGVTGTGAWVLQGEASYYEDRLVSIALIQYTYLPGSAHGSYLIQTTTYDLATNQALTLPDLFKEGADVYEQLSRISYWMLLDSGQLGEYADPQWISAGTEPTAENFSAFMVQPEGLLIIFAPYQIGPWALGEQRLLIPWSRLAPILNPEYFPAAE
jgi:hypothetical protein